MSPQVLSAHLLKRRIELKAYAYGVSSVVATLLGEYVVDLLRQSSANNRGTTEAASR